eukprot:1135043-Rhodomonas_salina.1
MPSRRRRRSQRRSRDVGRIALRLPTSIKTRLWPAPTPLAQQPHTHQSKACRGQMCMPKETPRS